MLCYETIRYLIEMYWQSLLELFYIEFQKHLFVSVMDEWQLRLHNYNVKLRRLRLTSVAVKSNVLLYVCILSFQYANRIFYTPYFIVIYGLSGSAIFFLALSHKRHDFRHKQESYWTWNVYFDFLYNICPKYFLFQEEFDKILP